MSTFSTFFDFFNFFDVFDFFDFFPLFSTFSTFFDFFNFFRLFRLFTENNLSYQLSLKDPAKASSPYLEEKAYMAGPVANVLVVESPIRRGVTLPESNLVLYGHEDLFAASELVAKPQKGKSVRSTFLSDLQDLKEGDLIVHVEHGIGRFVGLRQVEHSGRREDLMMIEYADRARLYLPLQRLDLIQKYHGAGGRPPVLDRMGGQTWTRTRSRVKAKLLDMADELIKLYASRGKTLGFAFSPDSNWQREFEEAFEFTETPDQIQSISDIKKDMESDRPMDRLICGDVGFGKTEVAMRAIFKALGDGKQAAVLAPTTVLAFQHYETFSQRFASFPIEIEMLTRFRTRPQQKEILERLTAGKVDVLIGTHRLLLGSRPARCRRGAALWRPPQRAPEADHEECRRADAHGHADSEDAPHVAGRAA